MRRTLLWSGPLAALLLCAAAGEGHAAESESGQALLERNCGRCHAVTLDTQSALKEAPNLRIVLSSYPTERLEFELGEGIGSRHKDMPQIQFTPEQVRAIVDYVTGP
jgi:mono/diheme cytochrome c family protein